MSEEEIINKLLMLKYYIETEKEEWQEYTNAIYEILVLYNKEKMKKSNLKDKIITIANERNKNNLSYEEAYIQILDLLVEE